ncbi:MAG: host-nuclease inhibitor Gam family protein [Candidatus Pacebacteria bacterium]|nr:host-nuclease inhibitor Gam family protein [Candidatus Paceibacterota bacterium]
MATNSLSARIKKTLTIIPKSIQEATSFLVSIGDKQREINRIKRETRTAIDTLKSEADRKVSSLTRDRDAFFVSLFAFAAPKKVELTQDARSQKTVAGTFGWRWTTPMVDIVEGKTDQDIIAALKRKGLTAYIRIVEELDREAMLRDRPEVSGVSYTQRDEFFAKPKLKKDEGSAEELVKTDAIDV